MLSVSRMCLILCEIGDPISARDDGVAGAPDLRDGPLLRLATLSQNVPETLQFRA
jgi:hypothetical protein